ncbi:MAG: hypothetical protein WC657_02500 [Candidatus Paceibacterota bacterium]|jgi:hypothetical protein
MNYIKFVRIFLLVLIIIGIGLLSTQKMWVPKIVDFILRKENIQQQNAEAINNIQNNITLTSKVSLSSSEKEQILDSVDGFINEYKLPKGIQNTYKILIEKQLNESIRIVVNPGEEGEVGNLIIYARRVNNVWRVDPNGGPWCTLEEFDQQQCF